MVVNARPRWRQKRASTARWRRALAALVDFAGFYVFAVSAARRKLARAKTAAKHCETELQWLITAQQLSLAAQDVPVAKFCEEEASVLQDASPEAMSGRVAATKPVSRGGGLPRRVCSEGSTLLRETRPAPAIDESPGELLKTHKGPHKDM